MLGRLKDTGLLYTLFVADETNPVLEDQGMRKARGDFSMINESNVQCTFEPCSRVPVYPSLLPFSKLSASNRYGLT
jgi:hypothetical protein